MKRYLTEKEFSDLRPQLADGRVRLRISKSVARQFFLRVDNASIRNITGESLLLQKTVIRASIALGVILMLSALYVIIREFGWGAALAVPLAGIFWTVIAGFTSERGNWQHGAIGLALALALAWFLPLAYGLPLVLMAVSLMLLRIAYDLAQRWVEGLVMRSFPAYDMLVDHVDVDGAEFMASPTEST